MKLTKSFIQILKQKLSVGSSRSILLNAIPGRLTSRLSISDLDIISSGMSEQFLKKLTSQNSFDFRFSIELNDKQDEERLKRLARLGKRLSAIKYDYDDYVKEHGIETFGFGFPILLRRNPSDSSKYIAAPIFIFPLDIKQSFDKSREWVISRNNESEIRINEVLASYLESEEHIKIPTIPEEMLEDGLLDQAEIGIFCKDLISRFSNTSETKFNWKELDVLPEKLAASDAILKETKIVWNGTFGLYKGQKQNLLKEMNALLADFDDLDNEGEVELKWEQSHSPMVTDPSQNGVLRSLSANKDIVIQGPPGTGKSQTLTAIVSSALSNNKKVLIVCEKRTALEVLKKNLEKLIPETSKCIALIEDVTRDRTPIVEIVRNRTASYLVSQHNIQTVLKSDIDRFEVKAEQIQRQYHALNTPIWRNMNWSVLVSKWIKSKKPESEIFKLYNLQKVFQEQNLADQDYYSLIAAIEEAAILFAKVKGSYHELEDQILVPSSITIAYEREVIFTLKDVLASISSLKQDIDNVVSEFVLATAADVDTQVNNACRQIIELEEIVNLYSNTKINIFSLSFSTKLKAIFINKYKVALQKAIRANQLLISLNTFWNETFNEPFAVEDLPEQVRSLKASISVLSSKKSDSFLKTAKPSGNVPHFNFEQWQKITSTISRVQSSFSSLVKYTVTDTSELKIDDLITEVNQLNAKGDNILSNETNVKNFFAFKTFVANAKECEKKWIDLLMKMEPNEWVKIVEDAWLYYKLIQEDQNGKFPTDDSSLKILKELGLKIQNQQKDLIVANINSWFISGQKRVKNLGIQINQLFNLRGSRGTTRNSLRKIIHADLVAFTDFFPVLMLNPSTCSSLLPLQRGFFDIVIFDEASQLRIEDTYSALLRGKQIVVSGDSKQMPPSSYFESSRQVLDDETEEEDYSEDEFEDIFKAKMQDDSSKDMAQKESLLEFAIDAGFKETYLDMHYRSQHPDLIEFSNASFYSNRLVPMPERAFDVPIRYIHVGGLYENRQNTKEAEEVVRILKEEIDENLSVGVATFNLNQRNLILQSLNDERANDPRFQRKMDKFDQNGFFVKNLENIQGDEKDVILISTTFGVKNDGKFIMNFGPITQKNGHRLLNVILTRAKNKLYVLTSIPEAKILDYRNRLEVNRKVDGATGLLAYLDYARAVSEGNTAARDGILEFIRIKTSLGVNANQGSYSGLTESPFEEEVYSWLAEAIGADRIKLQYKCGGFRIDMVVFPKKADSVTKLAIECDGAAYHSDQLSWHYDMYRQEQLELQGFTFHRIWSTNWWRKPEEEFQKLLKTIDSLN